MALTYSFVQRREDPASSARAYTAATRLRFAKLFGESQFLRQRWMFQQRRWMFQQWRWLASLRSCLLELRIHGYSVKEFRAVDVVYTTYGQRYPESFPQIVWAVEHL